MSILSKIKYWYLGGPLPTKVENKDGTTTCRSPDIFEPSISARLAKALISFFMLHWKFIIPSAIAVAAYFGYIEKP